jgi:hypothetical protein
MALIKITGARVGQRFPPSRILYLFLLKISFFFTKDSFFKWEEKEIFLSLKKTVNSVTGFDRWADDI